MFEKKARQAMGGIKILDPTILLFRCSRAFLVVGIFWRLSMHFKRLLIIFCIPFCGAAYGDQSVDDCILNGMRGVNNDTSARLIKQSCENKYRENFYREFGEITNKELKIEKWASDGKNITATVFNTFDQTITLATILVSVVDVNGACSSYKNFVYKTKLKPDSSGKFVIPASELINKKGEICLTVYSRLARTSQWNDFSVLSSLPVSDLDLATVVQVYSFKLGHRFEP